MAMRRRLREPEMMEASYGGKKYVISYSQELHEKAIRANEMKNRILIAGIIIFIIAMIIIYRRLDDLNVVSRYLESCV